MFALEIRIPVASEWPTTEELKARNIVEEFLDSSDIGMVSGAGGGMGEMDLAYRVDTEAKIPAARALIEEAMRAHMPDFQYAIKIFDYDKGCFL
jgi:hypothetical protein